MKIKAAVLYQFGKPLVVEEIDLDPPGSGEVLVKLVGAGVCHTDLSVATGHFKAPLPIILGHEGAGIIAEVGPDVTSHKPGDHVILSGAASCGKCQFCMKGRPNLCEVFHPLFFGGTLLHGERRLRKGRRRLSHFFGQSSFAEYSVAPQEVAIKVRSDAPLEVLGPLGCGVTTGLGSVINAAQVKIGSSVAVFGCGGVGMSAIMGARLVGAGKIIAIDLLSKKLRLACEIGATHTIDASKENPVDRIRQLTSGGVDYAIVAVENDRAIRQAMASIPSGGQCILVGGVPAGMKIDLAEAGIFAERTLRGVLMGSGRTAFDIPHYVDFFMDGRLPIDKLITKRYSLADINTAFEALAAGEVIKPVITFRE